MDRTINILNRILLGLTAIYAFMAVLGAFSADTAVDHAEVVFLTYGATAFFLFLSGSFLRRRFADTCAVIAYGFFAFSIALGLFEVSIAGLVAGISIVIATARQRYQNLDSTFLTGCMLSYWIVMYGFSASLIGKVSLITDGWDVIFYPFYFEGIKHIALSWRGLFILFGGWLFTLYVNRSIRAAQQAKQDTDAPMQANKPITRSVSVTSTPVAATLRAAPVHSVAQEQSDEEDYEEEEEFIEDNEDENKLLENREEVLHASLATLDQMVGLAPLKSEIKSFMKQMQGHQITQRLGKIASTRPTLHMIFSGPPGTGKTEMARIMVDLLYGLNLIEERVLIEADRSSIVGTNIGQTEEKMINLLEQAWGGVFLSTRHMR